MVKQGISWKAKIYGWWLSYWHKYSRLIGLDIGSAGIKAIELCRINGRYRLEKYAYIHQNIHDFNEIKLKNACKIAVAIPDSVVMTKAISLEAALGIEEIESQILVEAERVISYPLTDISLDFQVLSKTDVFLVMTHKQQINAQLAMAHAQGLTIQVIDVQSYALERGFRLILDGLPLDVRQRVIALMDLGATTVGLLIFQNGERIFSHYAPRDLKEALILQIQRVLQFFTSATIQQLFLAGGGSLSPKLADQLQEQLSMPVILANPFTTMQLAPEIIPAELEKIAPSLLLSCGLALRRFDEPRL